MKEKEPQVRTGKILTPDKKEREVTIVDNGEKFEGKGSTPNHDKVEIIYQKQN